MPSPPLTPTTQWVDTASICRAIGCSPATLRALRERRVLQPGQHWRRVGAAGKGGLRWDAEAVERTLREQAVMQEAGR